RASRVVGVGAKLGAMIAGLGDLVERLVGGWPDARIGLLHHAPAHWRRGDADRSGVLMCHDSARQSLFQRSRLLSPCYLYWSANAQRLARGQRGLQRRPAGVAVDLRHPSIADMLDERSQLIAVAIAYRHAQLRRQHAMPLPPC